MGASMKLVLEGVPISQIRAKYSGRNGIGRIYDPREKVKRQLKKIIANMFGSHDMFLHPHVSFVFHMPIPKSIPKKLLPLYRSGTLKHEVKPDADNLIKLYLDCMDGILFDGDQKVCQGPAPKLYHPHPKTLVIINEASSILSPHEVGEPLWRVLFGPESDISSCVERDAPLDSHTLLAS